MDSSEVTCTGLGHSDSDESLELCGDAAGAKSPLSQSQQHCTFSKVAGKKSWKANVLCELGTTLKKFQKLFYRVL